MSLCCERSGGHAERRDLGVTQSAAVCAVFRVAAHVHSCLFAGLGTPSLTPQFACDSVKLKGRGQEHQPVKVTSF